MDEQDAVTARILSVPAAEYHADAWTGPPRLSKSIAHLIVTRSALHGWHAHPRSGNPPTVASQVMDEGRLTHDLLLTPHRVAAEYVVLDVEEYRSNADKAARDEVIASGRTPIKAKHFAPIIEAVGNITKRLAALGISLLGPEGANEQGIEFEDDGVLCKGMPDRLILGDKGATIIEVKTINNAHPDYCRRQMTAMGYDIGEAAYRAAVRELRPDLAGRIDHAFVFCELTAPWGVTVGRSSGAMRARGELLWKRARGPDIRTMW